jgi:DNA mismatch repair ATPase MutS
MDEREALRENYLKSAQDFRFKVAMEEKRLLLLSVLRLVSFIGAIVLLLIGVVKGNPYYYLFFILAFISFLFLVRKFSVVSDLKKYFARRAELNKNEAAAISGDLSAFDSGDKYQSVDHDFTNDADIFGNSSLFQYLNRTVTGYGRDTLASWLSDPFPLSAELAARQKVIRELSLKENWRHHFMASGIENSLEKQDIERLIDWLSVEPFIAVSAVRKAGLIVLPFFTLVALALVVSGVVHYSVFTFLILLNLAIVAAGMKKVNGIHNTLSGRYREMSATSRLLAVFEKEHFTSDILLDIQKDLTGSGNSASVAVKKLGKLSRQFDSRLNILAALFLNAVFLWDYQSVYRLEKWKIDYKNQFPVWLEMLGSVDAYISLANYSSNNPGFAYPVKSFLGSIITARDLGHPLIEAGKRICNDFSAGCQGTLCIITGANMAGKSTFLRTVAVNSVLAMAGAPVCASEMLFMPMRLFTSMRTTDSLPGNESYFYAELKRLKILKSRVQNGESLFFILDEILKGTNSADKSLGSKLFLKKMIELKGSGMIATHDTSVCEMENEFPQSVMNKCFEIEIEGELIKFDYKLNDGITRKMNAALLMKQMGIIE